MICIWAAQFLAAVWTFLSLACLQAHAQGTPRIQFDRTVFDFGRTSQVQQLRGKFIVRNAGDATLQLDKPVSSCGCLSAELSAQTVQPGGRAELNFSINLAAGRQLLAKQIKIGSNDPRQPQSTVEVRVENIPLYDLDPMWVNLADMRKGDAASFEVSIHRTDGKKLGLTRAAASTNWITATLAAGTNTSELSGRVLIDLKASDPPRHFNEFVSLYAENSNAAAATITIYGRILGFPLPIDGSRKPRNLTEPADGAVRRP